MSKSKGCVTTRWSVAKCAHVAFWTGKGRSSQEIADILADGTLSATIRHQWYHWKLPIYRSRREKQAVAQVNVPMSYHDRLAISRAAKKVGIEPEEFLRRISLCAAGGDLYQAITAGRYDK